ncbi:hypothetical protein J4460_03025 [Candidatus Woesearchaeota archaeon]|nr:MAG: hypothetical protein QS99_C0006G0027 [archaeon GW2011_AR4]MBS3129620.1 hypothetical protein [Candidatus Woesearchaeota archaeon]HIH37671.1 hypothetical protein [Candidatus Woesearchaeota archaeon]HIH48832.1 hypothetical protein [Candidatus Woesearchaeota archaeon]HIJ02930.1 hypothetical protein [Candidatus Woesearchaeota archaeon]
MANSPYTRPFPGLEIVEGAPAPSRPNEEEIASYPGEAASLLERNLQEQARHASSYNLGWLAGRHLLLAGASGQGLGFAVATALLPYLDTIGSITILSRDMRGLTLGYFTTEAYREKVEEAKRANHFFQNYRGMTVEGNQFAAIQQGLHDIGATDIIYINTVAAASCGLLEGQPTVYSKDVRVVGGRPELFQWRLTPLEERQVEATINIMGTMAVQFPQTLRAAGFSVSVLAFADWRGSLDVEGRDPSSDVFGRQGAYSTSLYLPKLVIQDAVQRAFGTDQRMIDVFFPTMDTRALAFIPGGKLTYQVYHQIMGDQGIRAVDSPELALGMLDAIGRSLDGVVDPFPRLDHHEAAIDKEVIERILSLSSAVGL